MSRGARQFIWLLTTLVACTLCFLEPSVAKAETTTTRVRFFQKYAVEASGLPNEFSYTVTANDVGPDATEESGKPIESFSLRRDADTWLYFTADDDAAAAGTTVFHYTVAPKTPKLTEGLYYLDPNTLEHVANTYLVELYVIRDSNGVIENITPLVYVEGGSGNKIADPGWRVDWDSSSVKPDNPSNPTKPDNPSKPNEPSTPSNPSTPTSPNTYQTDPSSSLLSGESYWRWLQSMMGSLPNGLTYGNTYRSDESESSTNGGSGSSSTGNSNAYGGSGTGTATNGTGTGAGGVAGTGAAGSGNGVSGSAAGSDTSGAGGATSSSAGATATGSGASATGAGATVVGADATAAAGGGSLATTGDGTDARFLTIAVIAGVIVLIAGLGLRRGGEGDVG